MNRNRYDERGRQPLDLTARKQIAYKLQEVYAQLQPMIHISVLTSDHTWLELSWVQR